MELIASRAPLGLMFVASILLPFAMLAIGFRFLKLCAVPTAGSVVGLLFRYAVR